MTLYIDAEALEAGLVHVMESPPDEGTVALVVRRPTEGEREVLEEGLLDVGQGLVGDDWLNRGMRRSEDGSAPPGTQLTSMNARVIALIAGSRERWALAGDQLYVDLDLSPENLPPRTRLSVGAAVIETANYPHTGCAKFSERFGPAAIRLVNSPSGRALRLHGIYARVVQNGPVRPGDAIRKL
jgi:hypothetical protein